MATVSIADQVKALIELQGLDGKIYQLGKRLAAKPSEIAALKGDHQQTAQGYKAAEDQHKALEVKRNQMEGDLAEKENQIKKLQGQLFQVKTNKEYSAMQKEIEGLKADKSVLEEEILKFMEEIDRSKARLQAERDVLKQKEAGLQASVNKVEQEAAALKAEIEQLRAARQSVAPKVDPQILSRYERILQAKEGLALVPVRGNACGGCNIVLPPQMVNEIMLAARLIVCESCARILYIEPSN